MATYTLPTVSDLKLHWPAFVAVDNAVVQYNIDRGARGVDTSWTEGDYTVAVELLACHYMTLAGLGTGGDAEINLAGLSGFSMIRSGQLTLQQASGGAGSGSSVPDQWSGSLYGRQYYWLLIQNRPRAAVASSVYPCAYPPFPYPGGYW